MPSVDVTIPNYNYGNYLRDCVESIITQGIKDLRILIMDNASEDNSVEVAQELSREYPCIEVLARKANVGLLASLNEGSDWAQSDYLISLSADDLLPPGALARAIAIMEKHDDVVAAFGKCLFFHNGNAFPGVTASAGRAPWQIMVGRDFIERLLTAHLVTLSPVVRTRIQKKVGYYRPGTFSPDFEMWLRWACLGKIGVSRAPQAIQRLHQSNISNLAWSDPKRRFEHAIATVDVFFAHEGAALPNSQRLQRKSRRTIGKNAYWSAVSHLLRGHRRTAIELFRFALSHCPTAAVLPPIDVLMKYSDPQDRISRALSHAFNLRR